MFDVAMVLTVEERVELSALVHGRDVPAIVATRTQIVLWWTEGRRKKDIAMLAGVTRPTVDFWISRYAHEGTGGLLDRSRAAPREQVPARIRGRILGADPKQSAGGVGPVTLRFSQRIGRSAVVRTSAAAVMAPIRWGQRRMRFSAFHRVLSRAMPRSAGARRQPMSWLRAALSGCRCRPLVGVRMPAPAPW